MNDLSSAPRAVARPWWQRPSVISLAVVLLLLGGAMVWPLWHLASSPPGPGDRVPVDLPWQVQLQDGGGTKVFGLRPGVSSLAEVEQRFGDNLRVGLIVPSGGAPALEGFVESFQAGFINGKLALAFDAEPAWLAAAQARAPRNEVGEGGRSRRYGLAADDLPQARRMTLVGLSFIPAAALDEATAVQRFGPPAERLVGPTGERQLLYPAQGIAIALPPEAGEGARAKAVIQYVAPQDVERRVRAPLRAAQGAASQAAAASAGGT